MNPEPEISRRALVLACCFSAVVWGLCIAALAKAFTRDHYPEIHQTK